MMSSKKEKENWF